MWVYLNCKGKRKCLENDSENEKKNKEQKKALEAK